MKTIKYIILLIFVLICVNLSVQANFSEIEKGRIQFLYEIGISNGIVYNFAEEETAYGLHIHFIKNFGISQKVGVGVGYEIIFDEHKHNTLCVLLHIKPIEHFSINLAPGLVFLESELNKSRFALHVEAIYEFETGPFHFGPFVGAAISPEDFHTSVGLHVAFGF